MIDDTNDPFEMRMEACIAAKGARSRLYEKQLINMIADIRAVLLAYPDHNDEKRVRGEMRSIADKWFWPAFSDKIYQCAEEIALTYQQDGVARGTQLFDLDDHYFNRFEDSFQVKTAITAHDPRWTLAIAIGAALAAGAVIIYIHSSGGGTTDDKSTWYQIKDWLDEFYWREKQDELTDGDSPTIKRKR